MAGKNFAQKIKYSFLEKISIWFSYTFKGNNPYNRLSTQIKRKFRDIPGFSKETGAKEEK